MSDEHMALDEARRRVVVARSQFRIAVQDAVGLVSPSRLKAEAAHAANRQIQDAKAALGRSVKRNPAISWTVAGVLGLIITYLLRRPAVALARRAADTLCVLRNRLTRRK